MPGMTGTLQPGTGTRPILSYGPWYTGRYDALSAGIRKRIVETIQGRLTVQDFLNPVPQRIVKGVVPPSVSEKTPPGYSHEARLTKREGTVVLSVVVTEMGYPASVRLIRSLGFGLDEEAVHAVRQWRFYPGTKDGDTVPVQATIEVNFRLL